MISQRWACANNLSVANPDPVKPSSYIMYLDANNLYGYSMSEPLPYGEFEWITHEANTNWIISLEDHTEDGYNFEVDSPHLYNLHNVYPLATKKMKNEKQMLYPYTQDLNKNIAVRCHRKICAKSDEQDELYRLL